LSISWEKILDVVAVLTGKKKKKEQRRIIPARWGRRKRFPRPSKKREKKTHDLGGAGVKKEKRGKKVNGHPKGGDARFK